MVSLTQWTWIWSNSGRLWWSEELRVLQSRGSQKVEYILATKKQQEYCMVARVEWIFKCHHFHFPTWKLKKKIKKQWTIFQIPASLASKKGKAMLSSSCLWEVHQSKAYTFYYQRHLCHSPLHSSLNVISRSEGYWISQMHKSKLIEWWKKNRSSGGAKSWSLRSLLSSQGQ